MSENRRIQKINSLLKEAISDVIKKEVDHPKISGRIISITRVEVSKDLQHAKVFISALTSDSINIKESQEITTALQTSSKFITIKASKQVNLRFFPVLYFIWDNVFSYQDKIEQILLNIKNEKTG